MAFSPLNWAPKLDVRITSESLAHTAGMKSHYPVLILTPAVTSRTTEAQRAEENLRRFSENDPEPAQVQGLGLSIVFPLRVKVNSKSVPFDSSV